MLHRIGFVITLAFLLSGGSCGSSPPVDPQALCKDGVKDGAETDVDCGGGVCMPCAVMASCGAAPDCTTGVCKGGKCQAPGCTDDVKNGDETAVDCGGSCHPCANGAGCLAARDCESGVCSGATCQAASCTDGVKNGAETDADCGGGTCGPCQDGKGCVMAGDCTSATCQGDRCVSPTCTDGVKDGPETDVDCGGTCAPCASGKACQGAHDCASSVCATSVCQDATCMDGVKNGAETDADCGGGTCPRCVAGKACAMATDCASGNCDTGQCGLAQLVQDGMGRHWSDGTVGIACYDYLNPAGGYSYAGATGDGRYTIDPDGNGGQAPFDVYCDMTTSGGGWTLVDNDADTKSAFTTRDPGANPDVTVTRGSYLPAYTWSQQPQLLCKASVFGGAAGWVTLNAMGPLALEYPTKTTPVNATYGGQWTYDNLNGNTPQGTTSWMYNGSGRFGSVWIGNGGQPTCACDYYAPSPETGLGTFASGVTPTCSTWVR